MSKTKNIVYNIIDRSMKTLLVYASLMVCTGFLCHIYFPEITYVRLAVLCFFVAVLFSVPASFGHDIFPAWIIIDVGFLISVAFKEVVAIYKLIPEVVLLKLDAISKHIFDYMPSYSVNYPFDATIPLLLIIGVITAIFAFFFARCFFSGRSLPALIMTVICAIVCFIGRERNAPFFLLITIGLLLVILTVRKCYTSSERYGVRLVSLALVFFISASLISQYYDVVSEYTGDLALFLKFDKIDEAIKSLEGKNENVSIVYLPSESGGEYASVNMTDVNFAHLPVYTAFIEDYSGTVYMRSNAYYDFSGVTWTNQTDSMVFNVQSPLITTTGTCRIIRASDSVTGEMPQVVWSRGHHYVNFDNDMLGYVADAFMPLSPTNRNYFKALDEASRSSYPLPSLYVSQYYESDVDMATLAELTIEHYMNSRYYSPEESRLITALNSISLFLSQKRYTTSPTTSAAYMSYDFDHTPLYNFLYNTNEGYCVHFATAAVLLLREMGFTSRYAVGYSFKTRNNEIANVLDSYSHAWAEIYLDTVGWVPVEMTYGSGGYIFMPTVQNDPSDKSEEISEEEPSEESFEEESAEVSEASEMPHDNSEESSLDDISTEYEESEPSNNSEVLPPEESSFTVEAVVCLIILLIAAAITVFVIRIHKKCRALQSKFENAATGNNAETVKDCWDFALGLYDLIGENAETFVDISDFALKLDKENSDLPPLMPLLDLYLAAEFGDSADKNACVLCSRHVVELDLTVKKRLRPTARVIAKIKGKLF